MSGGNRLVEYFVVAGVDRETSEKQQRASGSASPPPTSPLSAVTEGEDGKAMAPYLQDARACVCVCESE